MTHYVIVVHNRLSEMVIRSFIERHKTEESRVFVVPYNTPKEELLPKIRESIPTSSPGLTPAQLLDSITFIAEANYGSGGHDVLYEPLFNYLLRFSDAKIIAFSSTPEALLLALKYHPRIEVLVNGTQEECDKVSTYLNERGDFSARIFTTRQSIISPGTRRRALTESAIPRYIPELESDTTSVSKSSSPVTHRRALSESFIPSFISEPGVAYVPRSEQQLSLSKPSVSSFLPLYVAQTTASMDEVNLLTQMELGDSTVNNEVKKSKFHS